jgi:hypothetical protein
MGIDIKSEEEAFLFRSLVCSLTHTAMWQGERLLHRHHSSPLAPTTKLASIIIQYFISIQRVISFHLSHFSFFLAMERTNERLSNDYYYDDDEEEIKSRDRERERKIKEP